jgi:hypothetical protein
VIQRWTLPDADPLLLDDVDAFLRRAAFELEELAMAQSLIDRISAARQPRESVTSEAGTKQ